MRGLQAGSRTVAVVALFALVTGCGSGESDDSRDEVPETAKGSLEQLADKVHCKPNIQTDAAELRQANCRNDDGRFILTTFDTDRGQREWINEANDYGGTYLVGRKWVAVGDRKVVTALRGRLGGNVEESTHHSGGGDGGHGEKPGGSGHSGHHGS
ncbi:hypothetical protein DY218_13110 [Streptomyces triticagri]|uniref:Lipoprotein n=1 Tax=Streptomyces triticagri TaxID=2293568 RepID=A0A372M5Y7_9ACTN|nr:hypothetical protein [Streptomyces triticagri]RFU86271.1 hypothetical protein DY218_13110 [Streptomyces triticagri]